MAKVKTNSFEVREKKNKKRSSIVKMSELRVENFQSDDEEIKDNKVQDKPKDNNKSNKTKISDIEKPLEKEIIKENSIEVPTVDATDKKLYIESSYDQSRNSEKTIDKDREDFFNLNIKNDIFDGKMTTVRVYDDILDKLKLYAGMKNYPIIEFTNKVIKVGMEDIRSFGILQISEIKLKNNTSRSIMYNLTDEMEEKLNKYIDEMKDQGYKVSRNVILNVILNETLKKFYS